MVKKNIFTQSKKKRAKELAQAGQFTEARKLLGEVCRIDRVDSEAWLMLGIVDGQLSDTKSAIANLRQAIKLHPDNAVAHFNLAMVLRLNDQLDDAILSCQEAVRLAPQYQEAQISLIDLLSLAGRWEDAVAAYRNLARAYPSDAEVHARLGRATLVLGNLTEAAACFCRALQLRPGDARLHDNLGCALGQQGLIEDALASHRQALQIAPHDEIACSNLLLTMQYLAQPDQAALFAEHRRWAKAFARFPLTSHANSREGGRRLRVGYVSADFCAHSVAFFIEPLLANHDANSVEIFCYSAVERPDAVTAHLRGLAHQWRNIAGLHAEQVAEMVRSDTIDILVDLAGHTARNALPVFARKPAPIQVSYLGYPDTSGLSAIDYRLTDSLCDPPGQEAFFSESLVRLSGCFVCYKSLIDAPGVGLLPAQTNGYVTFGSFNNLPKINAGVIELWAKLLRRVPNARLFIKSPPLSDDVTRERYFRLFEAAGIGKERIRLAGRTDTQVAHLENYKCLDIALDTFPYSGTTTTCEALWMGVPVVTLAGGRHAARVGVSLLNAAGLKDWVADTPEQYIALAAEKARDLPGLEKLRSNLRDRVGHSSLCDGRTFARNVENAYREMWARWCAQN